MSEKTTIERTYKATLEEIWELWTTKDGFESWWGPDGFRAEVHAIEAREGGPLHYSMIAATLEMVAAMKQMGQPASSEVHGRFAVIEPYKRLALAQMIDFLPGVKPYETTMLVELTRLGDRVRMVVTLDRMHSEQFSDMQKQGFTSQLGKLDQRFAS